MATQAERFGDVVVMSVEGEFSGDTVAQFRRVAEDQLAGQDAPWLVLDFEKVQSIDSGGLETLLWFRDKVEENMGFVKICALDTTCAKVFELTRFDRKFEVFESVTDAVKSYD